MELVDGAEYVVWMEVLIWWEQWNGWMERFVGRVLYFCAGLSSQQFGETNVLFLSWRWS